MATLRPRTLRSLSLALLLLAAPSAFADEPVQARGPAVAEWTLPDGTTRVLIHPEFRPAEQLRADLLSLKIPGLRVELVTPVAQRPTPLGDSKPPTFAPYRLVLIGPAAAVAKARQHAELFDVPPPLVSVSVLLSEVKCEGSRARSASLLFDRDGVADPKGTIFRGFSTGFDPDSYLVSTLTRTRPFEGTSAFFGDPNFLGTAWESTLRSLAKRGSAQFLAWPNLLVAEGRPGEVQAVENLPHLRLESAGTAPFVRLHTETVGLRMRVTAVRVGEAGALLDIDLWLNLPEVPEDPNTFIGALRLAQRQVRTRISVRDGEPLLIGGLFLRRHSHTHKGLPGLSGVSLVDALLSSDDKNSVDTELLVLVRARVQTPTRAEIRARKASGPVIATPAHSGEEETVRTVDRGERDPFEDSWKPVLRPPVPKSPAPKPSGPPASSADLDSPPGG